MEKKRLAAEAAAAAPSEPVKEDVNVDQFEESHPIESKQEDNGEGQEAESNDANSYDACTPIVKTTSKLIPHENRESK